MLSINLMTPIGYTGYGIAGLNILKQMKERNIDVSLFPTGKLNVDTKEDLETAGSAVIRSESFKYDAPTLRIWHQHDLHTHVGKGRLTGFPFFELNKLKANEIHSMKYPDNLVVASKWAADVCEANGIERPFVAPLGVDTTLFHPRHTTNRPHKNFHIINIGKWEIRKGHDVLVDILNKAFSPADKVEVTLVPYNWFLSDKEVLDWKALYLTSPLGDKISIVDRIGSHETLAILMSMTDVGIFPARAEGWNLELLEMMATGKHVIATDYSAHTEFCSTANCHLIYIDELESAYDGKFFFGDGEWAALGESQIEQAVDYLRRLYKEWQSNPEGFYNGAGVETASRFTWKHTVDSLLQIL